MTISKVMANVVARNAGGRDFCFIDVKDKHGSLLNHGENFDMFCRNIISHNPYKIVQQGDQYGPIKYIDSLGHTNLNYPSTVEELHTLIQTEKETLKAKEVPLIGFNDNFNYYINKFFSFFQSEEKINILDLSYLTPEFIDALGSKLNRHIVGEYKDNCLPVPEATPIENVKLKYDQVLYQVELELNLKYYQDCGLAINSEQINIDL